MFIHFISSFDKKSVKRWAPPPKNLRFSACEVSLPKLTDMELEKQKSGSALVSPDRHKMHHEEAAPQPPQWGGL
jgi:hypothetical protein